MKSLFKLLNDFPCEGDCFTSYPGNVELGYFKIVSVINQNEYICEYNLDGEVTKDHYFRLSVIRTMTEVYEKDYE